MPRRKKLPSVPDYTGVAPRQSVQKSDPFMSLSYTLSLSLLKILDVYLSRINSHDPEKRYVRFEKGELEHLMDVTKINKQDLDTRLNGLFTAVTIPDPNKRRGFTKIGLFEKAEALQDDDGLWQVDLACTPSAMEYIFNIENLHYLRYRLKNVVNLTSIYSYRMFLYLERNRYRKTWEESLSHLKEELGCTAETYNQFKFFNGKILKMCYRELNNKTECHFTYESVKKGRSVSAIRFTLETQRDLIASDIPGQMTIDQWFAENVPSDMPLWATACRPADQTSGCDFTPEEIQQIDALLCTVHDDKLPRPDTSDSIDIRRYHYMAEKYAAMMRYDSQKPIRHKANYMLQMLRNDSGIYGEE